MLNILLSLTLLGASVSTFDSSLEFSPDNRCRQFIGKLGESLDAVFADPLRDPIGDKGLREWLSVFGEIARFERGSGRENAIRLWIIRVATKAGHEVQQDAFGNLMVRMKGRGKLKNRQSWALQAHLDMINKAIVDGLEVGGEAPFRNGVFLELSDGWMHSRQSHSTIGADNGVGVALMLRYLLGALENHPPLELLFTVQEEVGLKGAAELHLPIRSKRLINLDGDELSTLWLGSAGSLRLYVQSVLPTRVTAESANSGQGLHFVFKDGPGGHSAYAVADTQIPHGGRVLVQILNDLLRDEKNIALLSARVGEENVLNVIPSSFEFKLRVAQGDIARITETVNERARNLWPQKPSVKIRELSGQEAYFESQQLEPLWKALLESPQGVLKWGKNQNLAHDIFTSNNFGFLVLDAQASADQKQVRAGFMPRSHNDRERDQVTQTIEKLWLTAMPEGITRVETKSSAWRGSPEDALIQSLRSEARDLGITLSPRVAAGGLEINLLALKNPHLQVASMGPNILGPHTPQERVELASVAKFIQLLDRILTR